MECVPAVRGPDTEYDQNPEVDQGEEKHHTCSNPGSYL